jgi:hypothetical protein
MHGSGLKFKSTESLIIEFRTGSSAFSNVAEAITEGLATIRPEFDGFRTTGARLYCNNWRFPVRVASWSRVSYPEVKSHKRTTSCLPTSQDLSARGQRVWIPDKWKSAFVVTGHERP